MEIAMKADEMPLIKEVAHLIEKCICPEGYAGLSCQVCYLLGRLKISSEQAKVQLPFKSTFNSFTM